jgi:DNA-binding transcriptional ArsR family regulator
MPAPAPRVFSAIADPTRRALFERLCRDGEQTVRALTERSGVSQPAVSKHLGVLKRAHLVHHRREGRQTHYRSRPQGLAPLIDWMSLYGAF